MNSVEGRRMMNRDVRRFVLTLFRWNVFIVLAIGSAQLYGQEAQEAQETGNWNSFRGGVHSAVAPAGNYPTSWDIATGRNVRWKASIPGRGQSSPIVSNEDVIVTTAYASSESARSSNSFETASAITQGVTSLLLGLCLAADIASIKGNRRRRAFYWGRGLFICSAGILLLFQLQLGGKIFHYERCPIRSWIGSHLAATLGTAIALSLTIGRLWMLRINVAAMSLVSLSILIFIPAKDHAYRNYGPQAFVVFCSAAIPVTFVAIMFFVRARRYRLDPEFRRRRFFLFGLLVTAVLALIVCASRITTASKLDHLASVSPTDSFVSTAIISQVMMGSSIGLAVSLSLYGIARRTVYATAENGSRSIPQLKSSLALLSIISCGGVVLALLSLVLNDLIWHSTFLQYHLPVPLWGRLNFLPVMTNLILFSGAAAVAILSGRQVRRKGPFLSGLLTLITAIHWPLHVIVTNAAHHESDYIRAVVALDRVDGSVKWIWEGLATAREVVHRENSHATPTPVVGRNRIVAHFGSAGLVCLDQKTGNQVWSRTDIIYHSAYGAGASLAISDRCVFVVCDAPKTAKIVAVDIDSGKTVWEHDRSEFIGKIKVVSGHSHTPLVLDLEGRPVVVVNGWNKVVCYDANSGDIISSFPLPGDGDRVASAASDRQNVYFGNPRELVAISKTSLTSHDVDIKWKARSDSNCVSPVGNGRDVYAFSDHGVGRCFDVASGKVRWQTRLAGEFRSSPIIAGGYLYFANIDGLMHVVKLDDPRPDWSTFDFSEPIFATPAAVDSQIFVRTESAVYSLQ